jgi:hypothetical protein
VKLFHFYRHEDYSGVSGTGPVVEGVEFTNGWCALRWISAQSSVCFYQSLDEVKEIHSHGGRTEIIVHDFAPMQKRNTPAADARFEILVQIIDETSRITTFGDAPGMQREVRSSLSRLRALIARLEWDLTRD